MAQSLELNRTDCIFHAQYFNTNQDLFLFYVSFLVSLNPYTWSNVSRMFAGNTRHSFIWHHFVLVEKSLKEIAVGFLQHVQHFGTWQWYDCNIFPLLNVSQILTWKSNMGRATQWLQDGRRDRIPVQVNSTPPPLANTSHRLISFTISNIFFQIPISAFSSSTNIHL